MAEIGYEDEAAGVRYVSTGHLPAAGDVQRAVEEAYQRYRELPGGQVAQVYPALARVPAGLFGICVAGTSGRLYQVGDASHLFAVMSVAKPFVFALVCEACGAEDVRQRLGVNATGLAFNSLAAVERGQGGRTNPMVNSGAIGATSLAPGDTAEAKWRFIQDGLSRFAGRALDLGEEVYASASVANYHNRAIASLLQSAGRIYWDPAEAIDLYTRQSCLMVTAADLAVMGATLADGGVNPLTGARVVQQAVCHYALAVMATAGMMRPPAIGSMTSGCPARAVSAAGLLPWRPVKEAWAPSPRSSMTPGTASRDSEWRNSCRSGWG